MGDEWLHLDARRLPAHRRLAGDRFGRRKVYLIGIVWFALASMACGLAPGGRPGQVIPGSPGNEVRLSYQ